MYIYKPIPSHLHFSKESTDMAVIILPTEESFEETLIEEPTAEEPTAEEPTAEEPTADDPTSMEIDIQELYQTITPETSSSASIAPWLVPILDHHKTRITRLARNAELGRTNVQSLIELRNSNKLPNFISSIQTPQVIEGLPELQAKWDQTHTNYQQELFKYLPHL
jgi:hypothetical protein